MERTLAILKPSCIERSLIGEIINRIEKRGIIIQGMKMIRMTEEMCRAHYSHLVEKPFFPELVKQMTCTPVIVICLAGVEVVRVFREMTGVTNGRNALPGTLRGDFCVSGQMNIVHASDSVENAQAEVARFFSPEELFDYVPENLNFLYGAGEI
ncbi:MAG: nucleoside-diphosphate kinase [Bacteroidales bacterium]|nr:nucleoside-diphosphate kinase [Bacteroidales bacterium]MDE6231155.1 nucleoside-diphosphate kinase [Muribaculaceae bacterium]